MTTHPWQPWATAQTVVAWLGILTATGLALLGGAAILADLADDTDLWHGLGIAIGIAAGLMALFLGAVFETVRRLTRRGVELARRGDPHVLRTSAHVGVAAVGVAVLAGLCLVGSVGFVSLVLLSPAALLAVPPVGILLTAPTAAPTRP